MFGKYVILKIFGVIVITTIIVLCKITEDLHNKQQVSRYEAFKIWIGRHQYPAVSRLVHFIQDYVQPLYEISVFILEVNFAVLLIRKIMRLHQSHALLMRLRQRQGLPATILEEPTD